MFRPKNSNESAIPKIILTNIHISSVWLVIAHVKHNSKEKYRSSKTNNLQPRILRITLNGKDNNRISIKGNAHNTQMVYKIS